MEDYGQIASVVNAVDESQHAAQPESATQRVGPEPCSSRTAEPPQALAGSAGDRRGRVSRKALSHHDFCIADALRGLRVVPGLVQSRRRFGAVTVVGIWLPPLVFKLSSKRTLAHLLLSAASAPLIHVLHRYFVRL